MFLGRKRCQCPPGSTVLSIIGLSDQTPLINFSGDKKAWPVYMTIGKFLARMDNSPVKMPILLLVLPSVPSNLTGDSARADQVQGQMNADVLRTLFNLVLAPLQQVV